KAQSPKPKAQSPKPKAQSPKPKAQSPKPKAQSEVSPALRRRYRELLHKTIIRLFLTYGAPFLLLAAYFTFQSGRISAKSQRAHLISIAEYQAKTLDLFLRERIVNLHNLIDDPTLEIPPSPAAMEAYLGQLQRNSDTFVDIGFFDSSGVQAAYTGPFPDLAKRDYSSEEWYKTLMTSTQKYIITDIYLGFRRRPHFTIALCRDCSAGRIVLRASLDPEKIYEFITRLEGAAEVYTSIVNQKGFYQVVTPGVGTVLASSSIVPPKAPRLGTERVTVEKTSLVYGYAWLSMADWALIAQFARGHDSNIFSTLDLGFVIIIFAVILLISFIILYRSQKIVKAQVETDETKAQLEHAAKLASVGELASGIAHEINNPLAIINEEAGLMKDLMNPEFGYNIKPQDLYPHLDSIQEAVFRCRDITRKLLGFVRRTEIHLAQYDPCRLIEEVIGGFLTKELSVSNIEIHCSFAPDLPTILTDRNQLEQVLLNIINNAVDAITPPGHIYISVERRSDTVRIAIRDTGKGMTRAQVEKIFLPFFTTKEVGKGTGLGLSVSYGIIKGFGGKIEVESEPGKGSEFTIVLPIR
ncbi:MAG: ATP-binding protein, partial [Calditrichota bacterium]